MIVFYDPNDGDQVMAVYSHDTGSTVWTARGYLRAEVNDRALFNSLSRDSRVTVVNGEVTSATARINAIQAVPDPAAVRTGELLAALAVRDLMPAELNELARLERGV